MSIHTTVRVIRRYPGSPISEQYRCRVWGPKPFWQILMRLPFGWALSARGRIK